MITAVDARRRADDLHAAQKRAYENKIAELWESWKPDIEKAIEENSAKGEYYCAVIHGGKSEDEAALKDMLARNVTPYGYKCSLCWMSHHSYRLKIEW